MSEFHNNMKIKEGKEIESDEIIEEIYDRYLEANLSFRYFHKTNKATYQIVYKLYGKDNEYNSKVFYSYEEAVRFWNNLLDRAARNEELEDEEEDMAYFSVLDPYNEWDI